jgi:hypothetical protein
VLLLHSDLQIVVDDVVVAVKAKRLKQNHISHLSRISSTVEEQKTVRFVRAKHERDRSG